MNALNDFPSVLHWTARDLADAVPLRLSELLEFHAGRAIGDRLASANSAPRLQRNPLRHDYLPMAGFRSSFRVY